MADQPDTSPAELASAAADSQRARRAWRLWAWLGAASLFVPVYAIIEPPALYLRAQLIQGGYHVVLLWTLVIYNSNNGPVNTGPAWSFAPFAFFSSSPPFNVGILFSIEFILLLAGCVLLFRQTGGSVCFITAAAIEGAVYAYAVLSALPQAITVYFLPPGPILAGIVGVGSLMLTRREEQRAAEHNNLS